MNNEQVTRFFEIKISMTNAKKLNWALLPESHQMNAALMERGYSFLSGDENGETILLKDKSDGRIYCFYCEKDGSFEQLGNADDPSLIRLYNIVYSQLLSVGAFYNEQEALKDIKAYAIEYGYTLREYENVDEAVSDCDNNFVVSWGTLDKDKTQKHIVYFALNHVKNVPPEEIRGFSYLRTIKVDQLSDGLIWVGKLQHIENLCLSIYNNKFPKSLACESTLRTLELHYHTTDVQSIPSVFRGIKKIEKLVLKSHDVTLELPNWLHEFPNLQLVDLRNCRIKSVPYSLVQTGLPFVMEGEAKKGILLNNVILEEGDISLFSQPRKTIESNYDTSIMAVKECKVIFLGDGAAGKTSLIDRMVYGSFQANKPPTDGIKMTKWATQINGESFTLRILDFGGQEIMHSVHRCFLTAHTVYVVVCENRDDTEIDSVTARWLETVKAFAPDCPVILALNKADLNANVSVNERDLKARNPALKCILKTSAKVEADTTYGVNHLIDAIRDEIPSAVNNYKLNKNMVGLKQALEDMQVNYISSERYRTICEAYQITDKTLQYSLLGFFRDLGVAYYYETPSVDTRLESVRVLNPEWLTNGIYRLILRTPYTGFLSHQVIKNTLLATYINDISPDIIYTMEEAEYILHVMRYFEISYDMGDGVEMIPLKMPKTPPDAVDTFPKKDALHLRWEGSYLPNNLIHRLLIRKFAELDTKCVWRTGGHFRQTGGGCEALAVMNEKALDIYVNGDRDCRPYLETFRDIIWKILDDLNLKPSEIICCTVDSQEGYVPYEDVIQQYFDRKDEIYIPGIRRYVNPAELLRDTYYNWEQEAVRYRQRMSYDIFPVMDLSPDKESKSLLDVERNRVEARRQINIKETFTVALAVFIATVASLRPDLIERLMEWLISFFGGL